MGFIKEEKTKKLIRIIKTVFFLITLLISFLFFSAPVLLAVADTLVFTTLLSFSFSNKSLLSFHFSSYDFRYSLVDIPLISIIRSLVIICVYSCCDGPKLSRGLYLWVATICSMLSLVFVSLKASFVFGGANGGEERVNTNVIEVALFICSYILAVGHVFVAYRTSCRERKKLLVYKIDIEAVNSACKNNGFPRNVNMLQEERKYRVKPLDNSIVHTIFTKQNIQD